MTLAVLRLIARSCAKDRTARVIAQGAGRRRHLSHQRKREWLRPSRTRAKQNSSSYRMRTFDARYSIQARAPRRDGPARARQATYLMPSAPEITSPGLPRTRSRSRRSSRGTLLPATAAPGGAPPAALAAARGQADAQQAQVASGRASSDCWPASGGGGAGNHRRAQQHPRHAPPRAMRATPATGREHSRHPRYADGSRRDRSDGAVAMAAIGIAPRRRDRDRNRRPGPQTEHFAERGAERSVPAGGETQSAACGCCCRTPGLRRRCGRLLCRSGRGARDRPERTDRPERGGRGRRGRRRGRAAGGGVRARADRQPAADRLQTRTDGDPSAEPNALARSGAARATPCANPRRASEPRRGTSRPRLRFRAET